VLALAGSIAKSDEVAALFSASLGIIDEPVPLEDAMARGAEFLERAAHRAAQLIRIGTHL
jgi:hypothetical protein